MTDQPTSVAETLRRAKEHIADPKRWCKGSMAKTSKHGRNDAWHELPVRSPHAKAWCALGALAFVDGPYEREAVGVLAAIIDPLRATGDAEGVVYDFNDASQRRHRDMMRAFDKAIAGAAQQATP